MVPSVIQLDRIKYITTWPPASYNNTKPFLFISLHSEKVLLILHRYTLLLILFLFISLLDLKKDFFSSADVVRRPEGGT